MAHPEWRTASAVDGARALLPADPTEPAEGAFEISMASLPDRDPTAGVFSDETARNTATDQVVDRLAEPLGQLAQEQLNVLLSTLDYAHREVMKAIRSPQHAAPPAEKPKGKQRSKPEPATLPPAERPPTGQLF